jgi:hypothetical protein
VFAKGEFVAELGIGRMGLGDVEVNGFEDTVTLGSAYMGRDRSQECVG